MFVWVGGGKKRRQDLPSPSTRSPSPPPPPPPLTSLPLPPSPSLHPFSSSTVNLLLLLLLVWHPLARCLLKFDKFFRKLAKSIVVSGIVMSMGIFLFRHTFVANNKLIFRFLA